MSNIVPLYSNDAAELETVMFRMLRQRTGALLEELTRIMDSLQPPALEATATEELPTTASHSRHS